MKAKIISSIIELLFVILLAYGIQHLREYFLERLAHYRDVSKQLPGGSAPVYQQMAEANGKK